MDSYLRSLAAQYAAKGVTLKDYTFVFPNRRAGLFFRKYIGQALDKPVWSPSVVTINDCFHELSPLRLADPLSLLVRLYAVYQQVNHQAEPFGQFLRWGQMMLADFSEIDNHLVPNVKALFTTISDLKELDYSFQYLSEQQLEAIRRFWGEVYADIDNGNREIHERFIHTWQHLYPCYEGLRQLLIGEGLAYEGLIHREVIEHFEQLPPKALREHYVFIGFNALTKSEEQLMLRLKELNRAEFCFDYQHPFLRDHNNRASLFLKHNEQLFHQHFSGSNTAPSSADYQLITVPSDVGETAQVYRLLEELSCTDAAADWTRTAVVLPDESMLLPLLSHIPPAIPTVNITMGFPLRATRPFIPIAQEQPTDFTPQQAIDRLRTIWEDSRDSDDTEATDCLLQTLNRIEDVLLSDNPYAPSLQTRDLYYVLRMLTEEMTIPYVGEPLSGLQIMGVLETRALDFDNLIIIGFNDELYPGKSQGNSYIPYTLRRGFGMPVPERQDAIFAYNFYRMIGHAKRVWFISNSQADEQNSGEVSRYWQQLIYQYRLPLKQQNVILGSAVTDTSDYLPAVPELKPDTTLVFSPSSLNTFLRCEQKYFYQQVLNLKEDEADDNEVDDRTLGTALHSIVQSLYTGKAEITPQTVEQMRRDIHDQWDSLPELDPVRKDPIAVEVVKCYVERLLDLDQAQGSFLCIDLEKSVKHSWEENGMQVLLKGKIDRIDKKDGIIRLIDYKTGHASFTYKELESAFTSDAYPYVLQTMTYCWLYKRQYPDTQLPIAPFIFPLRAINDPTHFSGLVHPQTDKEGRFVYDDLTDKAVTLHLSSLISRVIDTQRSAHFALAADKRKCENCSFARLCRR